MQNLDNDDRRLRAEHFAHDVVFVARDLVGRVLRVSTTESNVHAIIVETEAYGGAGDPASHAAFRPGGRAAMMFGEPGRLYVYAAYGMYPCVNIVAEPEGKAGAVLIRSVWVIGDERPTTGPGRTSLRISIGLEDQGCSINDDRICVGVTRIPMCIDQTPRIGIARGLEIPWRFVGAACERGALG